TASSLFFRTGGSPANPVQEKAAIQTVIPRHLASIRHPLSHRFLAIPTPPGRITVHTVESSRAVTPEIVLAVRRLFGVFRQLALEMLPPALVARALDVALQLAELSLVLVHGGSTSPISGRVQVNDFTQLGDHLRLAGRHHSSGQRHAVDKNRHD